MAVTKRMKCYVLVPVEVEILPGLEGEGDHIGTIRMPSEHDIKRSIAAHEEQKTTTWFMGAKEAWRELGVED